MCNIKAQIIVPVRPIEHVSLVVVVEQILTFATLAVNCYDIQRIFLQERLCMLAKPLHLTVGMLPCVQSNQSCKPQVRYVVVVYADTLHAVIKQGSVI